MHFASILCHAVPVHLITRFKWAYYVLANELLFIHTLQKFCAFLHHVKLPAAVEPLTHWTSGFSTPTRPAMVSGIAARLIVSSAPKRLTIRVLFRSLRAVLR